MSKQNEGSIVFDHPPPNSDIPKSCWDATPFIVRRKFWGNWLELNQNGASTKTVLEILEDFRDSHEFTHKKLCEATGIGKNTITGYLLGDKWPPNGGLRKILEGMKALGIPEEKCVEYFFAVIKVHIKNTFLAV